MKINMDLARFGTVKSLGNKVYSITSDKYVLYAIYR